MLAVSTGPKSTCPSRQPTAPCGARSTGDLCVEVDDRAGDRQRGREPPTGSTSSRNPSTGSSSGARPIHSCAWPVSGSITSSGDPANPTSRSQCSGCGHGVVAGKTSASST